MGARAMDFRILGPLEVWHGDRSLPLGGVKQRALLAILLTHANQVVATDRLIDLIWPDDPPDTAGHSLQVYVSQLRKVLEPQRRPGTPNTVLISQPPGYLVRIGAEDLDLRRFQRLVDEGRQSMSAGAPHVASIKLYEALGLWRGAPLADFGSQQFAVSEIARLTEIRLRALEDRIGADLALGRHSDLVGELESLVAQHPLREGFSRQLMLALYRAGRQGEASGVFQQVRERLVEELGMEPGAELQSLLKQILNQAPGLELAPGISMRVERRLDNLPLQLTSFVGRVAELAEVTRLLSQSRLVTITGAGGVGKTRLALQAAHQLRDKYRDGVWLVELAPLSDSSVLPQSVMAAMGVREQAGRSIVETLCDYLQARELLLVLDNCEHVIDATARLITVLLQSCPQLHVFATSREALSIGGENAWRVPSLSVPDAQHAATAEGLSGYEAVSLFVDRCSNALGHFAIDDENAQLVAEVCERLDGIPLAIELAAAKLRVLSLAQVAQRLSDRFRLLTGGSRTAMPRQQTLRAAIDWSYDLLSEAQQATLRRLSVFAGGISLEAAEAVCVEGAVEPADIIDLLAELVAKSLVAVNRTGGDARYRMLETIRQYAGERLVEVGEAKRARDRHRAWFQSLALQAETEMRGTNQASWFDRVESEHDNLRAALGWSLSSSDLESSLRLAGAMGLFWRTRGHRIEGLSWLERALAQKASSSQAQATILYWTSAFNADLNEYARAASLAEESLAMFGEIGDRWGGARAEQMLGSIAARQDRYDQALTLFHASLTAFEGTGDPWGAGWSRYSIGFVLNARGDYEEARGQFQTAVNLLRQAGDGNRIAATQQMLGIVELCLGDYDAARRLIEESLTPLRRMRDYENVAWSLVYLGVVSRCMKDYDHAKMSLEESLALFREVNLKQGVGYSLCEIGIVATQQGDLSEAEALLRESLRILHTAVDRSATAKVLEALAENGARLGQLGRSAQLLGSAEALRASIDAPIEAYELDTYRRLVDNISQGLSNANLAKTWEKGHAMSLEDAVSFAMRDDDAALPIGQAGLNRPPSSPPPKGRRQSTKASRA